MLEGSSDASRNEEADDQRDHDGSDGCYGQGNQQGAEKVPQDALARLGGR